MFPNNIPPYEYQGIMNHGPPPPINPPAHMNQPPPTLNPQPPLVYHFRGLHIDESMEHGLGRRAFVMRRQPDREGHRLHQYNPSHRRGHRNQGGRPRSNEEDHQCFLCGESLQNSTEPGVHLCAGDDNRSSAVTDNRPETSSQEDKDLKYLSELLDNLRKALKNNDAIKILGSCVKNLDVHTKAIDKELEKLQEDYGKQSNLTSRKIHRCVVIVRQNMAAWRVLVQKAAEETQRRETQSNIREKSLSEREKEITEEKLANECEIKRQMQELADEKQRLSELHETQKGRIKLDVGGKIFTTSISTLTRDSDSMLAAMFSGRHEMIKEKDGCIFIDRDGTNFRFILNYLRDGCQALTALPKSRQSLRELRNEAIYYQLFGLVQKVEKLI